MLASHIPADDIRGLPMEVVRSMFANLGDVAFYIKGPDLRFLCGNDTFYELCGVAGAEQLTGKMAGDFFAPVSQRCHDEADAAVIRTQTPSGESMQLTLRMRGEPVWLMCRRWPWIDEAGVCAGVVGVATVLEVATRQTAAQARVAAAIEHIQSTFHERYDVAQLAKLVGVSISQLERDFLALTALTPRCYIAKVRLETALELLRSDTPIVEIAQACGYSDQSAFTRRFRRATGTSPSQYRRGWALKAPSRAVSSAARGH